MSSINSLGSNAASNSGVDSTAFQQRQTDFQSLAAALQSNDLASAQQALTQIQKDNPKLAQALQNLGSNASNGNSPLGDLSNLATALNSGNLNGAQAAFKALQSHRHHGHHRAAPKQAVSASDTDGDSDGSTGPSTSTLGTVIDTSA